LQTSFGKQNVCLKSYKVVKTEFNLGYNNILELRSWTTSLVLRFNRGMDTCDAGDNVCLSLQIWRYSIFIEKGLWKRSPLYKYTMHSQL
jgi:hypothetical protein